MIIMSQDKEKVINFERITEIMVVGKEIIIMDNIYKEHGESIGTYSTEERAKEVLMEMCFCYKDANTFRYVANKMYRMPKE